MENTDPELALIKGGILSVGGCIKEKEEEI
jgi:hypothetical protein